MRDTSIIYMGTPDFAVEPLRAIIENGIRVKAVVTAPDKPAGRGKKVQMSAVKKFALTQNLPILQPTNLKDPQFIDQLSSYGADIFVVIAFRMLPKVVWQIPKMGTFNIHGSLLPDYRGAAPINWAIINGETKSGVTSFMINEEIDSGSIIDKREVSINENDNAGILHDKLMKEASILVVDTIQKISDGNLSLEKQVLTGNENPAPKIFKEDCEINWNDPIDKINNFIRGLSPYPGAWTNLYDKGKLLGAVKIYKTKFSIEKPQKDFGHFYVDEKSLKVSCKDGTLQIDEIQWPGKKRMDSKSFLNGFRLPEKLSILH